MFERLMAELIDYHRQKVTKNPTHLAALEGEKLSCVPQCVFLLWDASPLLWSVMQPGPGQKLREKGEVGRSFHRTSTRKLIAECSECDECSLAKGSAAKGKMSNEDCTLN